MTDDEANQRAVASRLGAADPAPQAGATAWIALATDRPGSRPAAGIGRCGRLPQDVLNYHERGGRSGAPRTSPKPLTWLAPNLCRTAWPIVVTMVSDNPVALPSRAQTPGQHVRVRVRCQSRQRINIAGGVPLQHARGHALACHDQDDFLTPDEIHSAARRAGSDGEPCFVERVRRVPDAWTRRSRCGAPPW
jgi:hypothetical protein